MYMNDYSFISKCVFTQYQEVVMTNLYTWKYLIQLSITSKVNLIKYHRAEFMGLGVFVYDSNVILFPQLNMRDIGS